MPYKMEFIKGKRCQLCRKGFKNEGLALMAQDYQFGRLIKRDMPRVEIRTILPAHGPCVTKYLAERVPHLK